MAYAKIRKRALGSKALAAQAGRLRAAGLRPTKQRMALAGLLFGHHDRHVTAEELHGEALAAGVEVSLATIYNTLNQFTAAGLLRGLAVDGARTYFDTNTGNHHHFYCEESGELTDIDDRDVAVTMVPAPPSGSKVQRVDVIVRVSRD